MGGISSLDLLTVGIAVAALLLIGVAVLFASPRDRIGRYFALFCFVNVVWGTVNYISYQIVDPFWALISLRLILFTAVFQAMTFYTFIESFASETLPRWFIFFGVPLGFAAAIPALTPLYFTGIRVDTNIAPQPIVSPAIGFFAVVSIFFVVAGLYSLIRQFKRSDGQRREQLADILTGTALMFGLIICLNFLAPVLLDTTYFVPLGAIFVLPFALLAAYAILRFQLFSVKAVATGTLTFLLVMSIFVEVIFTGQPLVRLWKIAEAVLVFAFGVMLYRSVVREVEQREEIQKLADELAETNKRQEGLIHFVGHEVKGFLTKAAGVFSMLDEGDLGPLPENMKPFIDRALEDTRHGVTSVTDILKASNLKKGTVNYTKVPFDLKAAAEESIDRAKANAEQKGLTLSFVADEGDFTMNGDRGEILDHVLRNLVDNAVNYTPSGSIDVSLTHKDGQLVFAVKDTGVGITEEDKKHLFTEGGHGKDSQKINVNSTGYGLFIAKQVTEAHGGTISASSDGPGKGSTFSVSLPFSLGTSESVLG